ncbi:MAG: LexA family transcriptional regulator [bacterium]
MDTKEVDKKAYEEIGILLHELRKKNRASLKEIASVLGVSYETYRNYEKGVFRIPFTSLQKLANFFQVPIVYFTDRFQIIEKTIRDEEFRLKFPQTQSSISSSGRPYSINAQNQNIANTDFKKVFVFSDREIELNNPIGTYFLPSEFLDANIIIKISGSSMSPIIVDGAYVGVNQNDKNILQGEMYAVAIQQSIMIRKIYLEPDYLVLQPATDSYKITKLPSDKFKPDQFVIGRVVFVMQRFYAL